MADTLNQTNMVVSNRERSLGSDEWDNHEIPFSSLKKSIKIACMGGSSGRVSNAHHEFGKHGGINISSEASTMVIDLELEMMCQIYTGELCLDRYFFTYSRHFNLMVLNLGRLMTALEGTEVAYCTASSMSGISSVMLLLCSSCGHVVASQKLYGGTHTLLVHFSPRACNITTSFVDIRNLEMVKKAIVEGRTNMLYFESVSNPMLMVVNVLELSRIVHEKGVTAVVDNNFAPMVLSPTKLGADIVVHNISKYISGGVTLAQKYKDDGFLH